MNKRGQNFLEYALVIGCVTLALFAMQVYFKRGIQGVIKSTSDDLASPARDFYSEASGKAVNSQSLGSEDFGLVAYKQFNNTTITQKQETVVSEYAKGERLLSIDHDNTVTTGNWSATYRYEDADNYNSKLEKSTKSSAAPAGADVKTLNNVN